MKLETLANLEPEAVAGVVGLLHFQRADIGYRQSEPERSEPLTPQDISRHKLFGLGLGTNFDAYLRGHWHFSTPEADAEEERRIAKINRLVGEGLDGYGAFLE